MTNLRSTLQRKRRPTAEYAVLIEDPSSAAEAVDDARRRLTRAHLTTDAEQVQAAGAALELAQADLDACRLVLRFHNMPAASFVQMVRDHPPTKQGQIEGEQWNADTFAPALLAACATDRSMTAEQWAEELASDRWSLADRNGIFETALSTNVRTL